MSKTHDFYDVVIEAIYQERERQIKQWGGEKHDDQHVITNWFSYIDKQSAFKDFSESENIKKCQEKLVKIAALAIAGLESISRKYPESFQDIGRGNIKTITQKEMALIKTLRSRKEWISKMPEAKKILDGAETTYQEMKVLCEELTGSEY